MSEGDRFQHWRNRAKKARDNAERAENPLSKRVLLGLADSYDRLAERNGEHLIDAAQIARNGPRKRV